MKIYTIIIITEWSLSETRWKTFILFQVSWLGEGSQEKQNENWPHFVVCMKMKFVLAFKNKKKQICLLRWNSIFI